MTESVSLPNASLTGLERGIAQAAQAAQAAGGGPALPPVHLWNPPFCGSIPMRIGRDGVWYYMNSPIGRKPLYTLFSKVLRLDEDGVFYLVTPVEKCAIEVEDAPLLAVIMQAEGQGPDQIIHFTSNCDDCVSVDAQHPLRFANEPGTGGLKPYVLVRGRLEALVTRALFYDLVSLGMVEGEWFGIWSSGHFFPMQKADELGLL